MRIRAKHSAALASALVIALAGAARAESGHHDVIEHRGQHGSVVALAAGHHDSQGTALAIDGGVDFGGQPSSRASNTVTCGFSIIQRPILVIRQCPLCPDRGGSYLSRVGGHG